MKDWLKRGEILSPTRKGQSGSSINTTADLFLGGICVSTPKQVTQPDRPRRAPVSTTYGACLSLMALALASMVEASLKR